MGRESEGGTGSESRGRLKEARRARVRIRCSGSAGSEI